MQPTCCAQPPRTPVGYLSVSLSLDATSSKAACRSAILRMDVSRSVWRVCLTVASSSTYFSWRRDHSHASLGQEPQPPTRAPGKRQTRAQTEHLLAWWAPLSGGGLIKPSDERSGFYRESGCGRASRAWPVDRLPHRCWGSSPGLCFEPAPPAAWADEEMHEPMHVSWTCPGGCSGS